MDEQPGKDYGVFPIGDCSVNSIKNLDNFDEIIQEEIGIFINDMKTAFIQAIDSFEEKEIHTTELNILVENCNLGDKQHTNSLAKEDENIKFTLKTDNMIFPNNNITLNEVSVVEIIDGEIKINIPKDPETIKLWKLLRKAMDKPIIEKKKGKADKRDLLGVSKYGEDDEAFFDSLIGK